LLPNALKNLIIFASSRASGGPITRCCIMVFGIGGAELIQYMISAQKA
jgi:hypothetical protein